MAALNCRPVGPQETLSGIEADHYRLLNDCAEPVLFDPKCFDIIDVVEPSFWGSDFGAPMGMNRRTRIALIPFVIAIPGLIAALILWFWPPLPNDLNSIVSGLVGAILAFDIPVCILVLLQWVATGEPPELSLSPLIPTREEREFHRQLRERPKLDDDEFYNTFYSNSPIPKRLAIQLRVLLEKALGLDFGALHPTDNLINADVELDWADIIFRINREFDVVVPEEMINTLDGTFDALLRCIAKIKGDGEQLPVNGELFQS